MSADRLEHARQMTAIHQARAAMKSLTPEEREAHHRMAERYERQADR
jgi:hypothetical protein